MKRFKLIIGIILFILFLNWFYFGYYYRDPVKWNEASVQTNMRRIESALGKYYSVKSEYPTSLDTLANDDVNDFLEHQSDLLNPFKRYKEKMINITPGDADFEGNYTYIPIINNGKVTGFFLYVYGSKKTPGLDIDNDGKGDHVIASVHIDSKDSIDEYDYYKPN